MTKAEKRKLVKEQMEDWNALKLWESFKDDSPEDAVVYEKHLSMWCKSNRICQMLMSVEEINEIEHELESKESA